MKNWVWAILTAVALGVVAFGSYSTWHHAAADKRGGESDRLEWLRVEFALSDEQFAQVQRIHAEYAPVCETLCAMVVEAKREFERAMLESADYSETIDGKLVHLTRIKEECNRSMLQHIYAVAAVMEPEHRQRYLEMARGQFTREMHGH